MEPENNIIGNRLKEIRLRSGNTMEQEASLLNQAFGLKITKSMMSRWEVGKSQPSSVFLSAYARYHDIDLNYIMGLTDSLQPLHEIVSNPSLKSAPGLIQKYRSLPIEGKKTVDLVCESFGAVPDLAEAVPKYAALDAVDRGKVLERMQQLTEDDKYKPVIKGGRAG